jgi:hypothetical protein
VIEGSWRPVDDYFEGVEKVPCRSLASLMWENGHEHIDLLKIDIEGSEYRVIEAMLADRLLVDQICVEYHHGMLPRIQRAQTIQSLLKLLGSGYRLIDQFGNNHIFIHKRCL